MSYDYAPIVRTHLSMSDATGGFVVGRNDVTVDAPGETVVTAPTPEGGSSVWVWLTTADPHNGLGQGL